MLFSTHAVPTVLCLAGLVSSATIPTRTSDLPYNVDMPGATPSYVPIPPAVLLPVVSVLEYAGAVDGFAPNSVLGQAISAAGGLVGGVLDTLHLDGLAPSSSKLKKRQLCAFLNNCPKPATSSQASTTAVATTTAAAAANPLCGVFGNCPKPTTTTQAASTFSTTTQPAPSSSSSSQASSSTSSAPQPSSTVTCVGSSATESTINTLFSAGGAGTTVYLCPSANINIQNVIQFTAANQTLTTRGFPTDNTRAMVTVRGALQSTAIASSCGACSFIAIRNIQIDGSRPALGQISTNIGGGALLEMGGSNADQILDNVHAFEPRSWSTVHAIEGNANSCRGMQITNNQIGPAGHAPSGAQQNRKRDTGYYSIGNWADGISLACQGSTVDSNVVTDATDGHLVIFGAPNSKVTNNYFVANERQTMGGVNMVDYNPYAGDFTGVLVASNTFHANESMIKLGVAVGIMTWGSVNSTSRTSGGVIRDNLFTSGVNGYFGYAIAIGGHASASVPSGNSFRRANFAGVNSGSCTGTQPPPAQPLIYDPYTTPNLVSLQPGFVQAAISFLICKGPSSTMTMRNYTQTYA